MNSQLSSMEENKEENEYEYIDFGPEEEGSTMKILFKDCTFQMSSAGSIQ